MAKKKLSNKKAKEILHHGEVHGHPLTDQQRKFFGAIAGGAKPYKAQNGIEGTMGGLTDKGFNFNPAWGGAWRNGGWLDKYQDGGELQPPMAGANQTIPMYAMGGSLPGSVGFMYTRTAGAAPSEGPYAKKTLPSAQNGAEMSFYQQGLDWTPKTISRNGAWLDKYDEEEVPKAQDGLKPRYGYVQAGDLATESGYIKGMQEAERRAAAPEFKKKKEQAAARARYEAMPKIGPAKQRNYSEQIQAEETRRRLNEAYAAQNPEITLNESGDIVPSPYGRFMQTYGPNIEKFGRSLETPLAIESAVSLAPVLGRGLTAAGEYLTTQTPLSNAYKINPWRFKTQEGNIYRQVGKPGFENAVLEGRIYDKGQKEFLQDNPGFDYLNEYNKAINSQGLYLNKPAPAPFFSKNELFFPINRRSTGSGFKKTRYSDAEYLFEGKIPQEGILPRYMDAYLKPGEEGSTFILRPEYNDLSNFNVYKRDWLRGYKPIETPSPISAQQSNFGSIYTLNPMTALGDLGDYSYYRKIGSGSGIRDLVESGAIRSGGGYDAPYFSPNTTWEGYRGTFAVGVNPNQVEGLRMINKNRGGLQRGFKSSLNEIPLSEGATGVFRRFPFSSAYTEIPVSSVLDPSKRTLREKILLNPTLANAQHVSEEALRYGIKGSVGQYILNELYGTEKDPTPAGRPLLAPVISRIGEDFKQSFPEKPEQKEDGGEVVQDNDGYWNSMNWGQPVQINSNQITMEGVNEPLLGISDTGDMQMMEPGKNYTFQGNTVTEYPREYFQQMGVARGGKSVNKADEYPLEKLDNLLNFTNYNKPKAKNGWLSKYED